MPRHSSSTADAVDFVRLATGETARWLDDLSGLNRHPGGTWASEVRGELPRTRRRCLARVLVALQREQLLPNAGQVDGEARIRLQRLDCELRYRGLDRSEVMLLADVDAVEVRWASGVEIIEEPARLLEIAMQAVDGDPQTWRRLAAEVTDSMLNEALAQVAHRRWYTYLTSSGNGRGMRSWPDRLRHNGDAGRLALDLEQWSAVGHPLHIVPKARVGVAPGQAQDFFPEFRPLLPVRLAALRRDVASVELPAGYASAEDYLDRHFPDWLCAWRERMVGAGLDPAGHVPLPVHPWHADRVLSSRCRAQVEAGELALLDGPVIETLPTLSVRSVVPVDDPYAPTLKLALGLRLTSGMRTISPRSCHMGARVCRLLRQIIERDPALAGRADLLDEELGIHYEPRNPGPDVEGLIGFLSRRAVASRLGTGEWAVPSAALALQSPASGLPLLAEITGCDSGEAALAAFRAYAIAFLEPVLRTYLVYGIALEGHGQNVLAVFGSKGDLRRMLFRDFGGIRIHEPTLSERGLALDVHPDRRTVVQAFDDHRFWLMHRVYHCHLGHLAYAFARHFGLSERRLWRVAGDVTSAAFDALRDEVPAERWVTERRVLLKEPWQAKASLRMRLLNRVRDVPVAVRNPLNGRRP